KPDHAGAYVSQHLNCARYGKTTTGKPRSEPDWGKPTVRDRRGGLRKRGPWWNEAPTSRIERASAGNSPPTVVRAADLSRPAMERRRTESIRHKGTIMWYSVIGYVVTLTLSLLAAPLVVEAQPSAPVPRIGLLSILSPAVGQAKAESFRQGLREAGYM